ncbi:unnamed protein product, partial [Heterosigma akashiwo]
QSSCCFIHQSSTYLAAMNPHAGAAPSAGWTPSGYYSQTGCAILQLLASKDQALLVRRDAFLVLNLLLDVIDGVRGLHIQGDGLAGQCFHKDLHATTQAQHQVQGGLLLDII